MRQFRASISRRRFVQGTVATIALPLFVPRHVLGDGSNASANQKIRVGAIGVGHMLSAIQSFESIFDGQTLKGWHVSAQTGHSRASQHQTGGRWVVEEGAIVGSQDIPGNGGILITDELFGDFEVVLKMNAVCSGHDGRRLGWMSRRECSRFS
jgi:hypothetical protein